jgi:hypothetical protein
VRCSLQVLTEVKDGLVPLIKAVTSKPQVHHQQQSVF